jgi:hypothetical protein
LGGWFGWSAELGLPCPYPSACLLAAVRRSEDIRRKKGHHARTAPHFIGSPHVRQGRMRGAELGAGTVTGLQLKRMPGSAAARRDAGKRRCPTRCREAPLPDAMPRGPRVSTSRHPSVPNAPNLLSCTLLRADPRRCTERSEEMCRNEGDHARTAPHFGGSPHFRGGRMRGAEMGRRARAGREPKRMPESGAHRPAAESGSRDIGSKHPSLRLALGRGECQNGLALTSSEC